MTDQTNNHQDGLPSDQQIRRALGWVLGSYFVRHPEIVEMRLKCYAHDGFLLHDHIFSPPPTPPSTEEKAFVKEQGHIRRNIR